LDFWELSLGIHCIVKGFSPSSPILAIDRTVRVPESPSAELKGFRARRRVFTREEPHVAVIRPSRRVLLRA
jgi:hypothetical protein